jgi:hypothetical protein
VQLQESRTSLHDSLLGNTRAWLARSMELYEKLVRERIAVASQLNRSMPHNPIYEDDNVDMLARQRVAILTSLCSLTAARSYLLPSRLHTCRRRSLAWCSLSTSSNSERAGRRCDHCCGPSHNPPLHVLRVSIICLTHPPSRS